MRKQREVHGRDWMQVLRMWHGQEGTQVGPLAEYPHSSGGEINRESGSAGSCALIGSGLRAALRSQGCQLGNVERSSCRGAVYVGVGLGWNRGYGGWRRCMARGRDGSLHEAMDGWGPRAGAEAWAPQAVKDGAHKEG